MAHLSCIYLLIAWWFSSSQTVSLPEGKPPFSYGFPMVFLWFSHWNLHFPMVKWNVPISIETRDRWIGCVAVRPGCLAAHGGRGLHWRRGWNAGGQAWNWWVELRWIPSGKRLHSYGKLPFFMGKYTISMANFNSYVKLPEGTLWKFNI